MSGEHVGVDRILLAVGLEISDELAEFLDFGRRERVSDDVSGVKIFGNMMELNSPIANAATAAKTPAP